jgi:hypothetical protein
VDLKESFPFGLFSDGQLFIHHSSSLLCCLFEFWVFRLPCRLNLLGARRQFQPQYGPSSLPMARGLFDFSLDNVLSTFTDVFILNFGFISWPLSIS